MANKIGTFNCYFACKLTKIEFIVTFFISFDRATQGLSNDTKFNMFYFTTRIPKTCTQKSRKIPEKLNYFQTYSHIPHQINPGS